jgi:hypothetical protein
MRHDFATQVPAWLADKPLRHHPRGRLAVEDGRYGAKQQLRWWWPVTVEAWEEERTWVQCPICPARVLRLGAHMQAHRAG